MNDFLFNVEDLRETRSLKGVFPPTFLDMPPHDIVSFEDPVELFLELSLSLDILLIHLNAKTLATFPCSICNQKTKIPVHIQDFYETVPLEEIQSSFFDATPWIREAILLELPIGAECRGNCPEREVLAPYLKNQAQCKIETYLPFSDL